MAGRDSGREGRSGGVRDWMKAEADEREGGGVEGGSRNLGQTAALHACLLCGGGRGGEGGGGGTSGLICMWCFTHFYIRV